MAINDPDTVSPRRSLVGQVTRRRFLGLSLVGTAAALVAACQSAPTAPAPPATPVAAKPTDAPKPAEATAKPAVQVAATATPAPAAAAPAPAATAQPAAAKPGWAEDLQARSPRRHHGDGPGHHELSDRLPDRGGDLQFHWPLHLRSAAGQRHHPRAGRVWEIQDGAKTWIFHLRKGVKFHEGLRRPDGRGRQVQLGAGQGPEDGLAVPGRVRRARPSRARSVHDQGDVRSAERRPSCRRSLGFRPGLSSRRRRSRQLGDKWRTRPGRLWPVHLGHATRRARA